MDIRHRQGLLWRVVARDGTSNVIFGTMHVADPRVLATGDLVRAELSASDIFAMEVVLDNQALAELQRAMFYRRPGGLRAVVDDELFAHTVAAMRGHGVPAAVVETMKPWAAFTTLSSPTGHSGAPLDALLMQQAEAAGVNVVGLETVADQIRIFESISETDQVDMLRETICHYTVLQAEIEQMVQRYVARDLRGLMQLSLQHMDARRGAFLDALLWRRNDKMVGRLRALFESGSVFVAVGALHLAGPRGILEQLERHGYVVTAIY
jgi:uncharacterized protein YbaP (TraB family)